MMRFSYIAAFLAATLSGATPLFQLRDTQGRLHTHVELASRTGTVFLFLAAECPLSNQYIPRLNELHLRYSKRGIAFLGVLADPLLNPREAAAHTAAFDIRFPVLLDPHQSLTAQLRASVTPQAILIGASDNILYRGRIDDRSPELGKKRRSPSRNDLELAIEALLNSQPIPVPETRATGCAIPKPSAPSGKVTFTRDVAPILFRHCSSCHRPGRSGPFPLLGWRDAAVRAETIAQVAAARIMPPWLPAEGPPHFEDERRLSPREIATLRDWASEGAPQGDPAHLPPAPTFHDGWQLGTPDLVVQMPRPFEMPASGPDQYRCFVLPVGKAEDRWVRAVEFHPGNRSIVHHSLIFADASSGARRRDAEDPGDGYRCFGVPGFLPSASYGGWTPGMEPRPYPDGVAFRLHRNADIVLQVHYHATGKPESDQSRVGLYFTSQEPTRRLMDVALGSRAIDIPPGESAYTVRDHFTLPVDILAVGIIPHAHYLCRRMRGIAKLPDGHSITLIDIPDWDFNWQQNYRYRQPFKLPADTLLEMEFTYDNSAANPRNPSSPPVRVQYGPDSTDEMAGLHLQVIPANNEDAAELGRSLWGKIMRELGGRIR